MKILVVVDMQNDFVTGSLGTKEAEVIIPNVVKKIEEWDGYVFATQDTHDEDYLDTQEGEKLPVKHTIKGTEGWKIQKDVYEALELDFVEIFEKKTFGSIDLALELVDCIDEMEIDEVQLIGVCTDICIISNALVIKAFLPEVKVVVDAACCAGTTPESHKRALETMKVCQVDIINED